MPQRFNNADFPAHYAEGNANRILSERSKQQVGVVGIDAPNIFYRYVVIDVISDDQLLRNGSDKEVSQKIKYWSSLGITNIDFATSLPRNTIIGKRLNGSISSTYEPAQFLFPFFPSHLALPCKPGEHVWVMFESAIDTSVGYWFCKITDVSYVDDVNHTHHPRAADSSFTPGTKKIADENTSPEYRFRPGKPGEINGEKFTYQQTSFVDTDDESFYEKLLTDSDASKLMIYESVPRFRKRPGDLAIEGSNNTVIVLGTDRTGPIANMVSSPDNKGVIPNKTLNDFDFESGAIDIVAGRGQTSNTSGTEVISKTLSGDPLTHEQSDKIQTHKELGKSESELAINEGNPDWINDKSRVLVAQRTKVDKNLGISEFNEQEFEISDSETGDGAIVIKSDKIRIVARKDVEFIVEGQNGRTAIILRSNGDIVFKPSDSGVIKLGGDDASLAVLCNTAVPGAPGNITATPIVDTMGGSQGGGGASGQFATKVLLK